MIKTEERKSKDRELHIWHLLGRADLQNQTSEVRPTEQTDWKLSFLGEETPKKCAEFRFRFDKLGASTCISVTRA